MSHAVEVEQVSSWCSLSGLGCVLLHLDLLDADLQAAMTLDVIWIDAVVECERQRSLPRERLVVLRDLISVWLVLVEVMLSIPRTSRLNCAVQSKRSTNGGDQGRSLELWLCAG